MTLAPLAVSADNDQLLATVLDAFLTTARQAIAARGVFRVSLSGGSTPKQLYQALAQTDLDFSRVQWFWGDERNVPQDHADSNYRMVQTALLAPAGIDDSLVFPLAVNVADPAAAARAYEQTLQQQFAGPGDRNAEGFPVWDLVLLGLGDDVHTASLFPHTAALQETQRWVVENWVEKLDTFRYTLTASAINSGREIWFLMAGQGKQQALRHLLHGPHDPQLYPAQRIRPTRFFLTADALPADASV